jgi:hypothetical protein
MVRGLFCEQRSIIMQPVCLLSTRLEKLLSLFVFVFLLLMCCFGVQLRSEEDFAEAMAGKTRGVQVLAGCPARTTTELVNARRTLFEFDCVVQVETF